MQTMSCFLCSACGDPFCGGRVDCAEDASLDITTLCCPKCAFDVQNKSEAEAPPITGAWRGKCYTHGYRFAIYKCDSCCSVATWDCRSNHYCERCHNNAFSAKDFPCPGPGLCPLGIEHPPNQPGIHGTVDNGFVIGCAKCFLGVEEDIQLASDDSAAAAVANWEGRF